MLTPTERDLIGRAMEVEGPNGILSCLYCGADNGQNEPPEDDAIRHEPDCEGVSALVLTDPA